MVVGVDWCGALSPWGHQGPLIACDTAGGGFSTLRHGQFKVSLPLGCEASPASPLSVLRD